MQVVMEAASQALPMSRGEDTKEPRIEFGLSEILVADWTMNWTQQRTLLTSVSSKTASSVQLAEGQGRVMISPMLSSIPRHLQLVYARSHLLLTVFECCESHCGRPDLVVGVRVVRQQHQGSGERSCQGEHSAGRSLVGKA